MAIVRENVMNIYLFTIVFLLHTLLYCGNPRVYYTIIKHKKSVDPANGSPGLTRENVSRVHYEYGEPVEPLARVTGTGNWISIDAGDEYAFWFGFLNKKLLSYLINAEDIQISKNFRLPKLQYFTFQFKYYGEKNMEVDFFNVYFIDEFGRKYQAVQRKEFKKQYTSIAYSWLDYQIFFVPYLKVSEGSESKYFPIKQMKAVQKMERNHATAMISRHKTRIKINNARGEIFHIVPFPDFFIGSKKFRLIFNFKIDGQTKQIDMPFFYVSSREDIKENSFKAENFND